MPDVDPSAHQRHRWSNWDRPRDDADIMVPLSDVRPALSQTTSSDFRIKSFCSLRANMSHLARLIQAAGSANTAVSLAALEKLHGETRNSQENATRILPVFLQRLRAHEIPKSSEAAASSEVIIASLHGMVECIAGNPWATVPSIKNGLRDYWPHIYSWSSFLIAEYLEKEVDTPEGYRLQAVIQTVTTELFSELASDSEIGLAMSRTKGLVQTIIRLYLRCATLDGPDLLYASRAQVSIIRISSDPLDQFKETMDNWPHPEELASGCLNRLLDFSERISRAFHTKGAIPVMLRVMSRISRVALHSEGRRQAPVCIEACLRYLQGSFKSLGPGSIILALDNHLIPVMLKSTWLARSSQQLTDAQISTVGLLRLHLVQYSVFIRVVRARKIVQSRNLDAEMKRSGILWDAWTEMSKAVDRQRSALGDIRALVGACGNVECCNSEAFIVSIARCSGCEAVHYCSIDCQKSAWDHGHKALCIKATQRRLEGFPQVMCERDNLMVEIIMLPAQIRANWQKLENEARRFKSDTAMALPVVDYRVHPPSIKSQMVPKYHVEPDIMIAVALVPEGERVTCVLAVVPKKHQKLKHSPQQLAELEEYSQLVRRSLILDKIKFYRWKMSSEQQM
ncbi:hypothetical protein C8J56DRAFT_1156437 [Mycena floridula]|nr:hypothetical protein C8J56DRAFT_1156437 [Mycena floridula]